MNSIILNHTEEKEDFSNFLALVGNNIPEYHFIKKHNKLFFDEMVYDDQFKNGFEQLQQGIFINKGKEGFRITWHDHMQIYSEGFYRDNEKDGLWTFRYERSHEGNEGNEGNGQKESEGSFVNGIRNGFWIFWYDNGQKKKEGSYQDWEEEDLWRYWDENGNESSKTH